jgi:hypothetical protein
MRNTVGRLDASPPIEGITEHDFPPISKSVQKIVKGVYTLFKPGGANEF